MLISNNNIGKDKWIKNGYKHFALYGPHKLSINKISKEIGTSRASFYHFFGDIDIFIDELLTVHWQVVEKFIKTAQRKCTNLFPDLYIALAEHPVELQFEMQLFNNRNNPTYNLLFIKSYETVAKAFLMRLFITQYNLNLSENDMYNLWLTVGETWFSRLNTNDLSAKTMQKIAEEILQSVIKLASSNLFFN